MKKIFTLIAGLALASSVNAAETTMWNFSDWAAGDITETKTVNGLTLYAGTRNNADGDPTTYKWTIDANSKTFSGISCTQRLKSNGNAMWNEDGTPFARVMEFKVTGPSTITIAAMSSSSGATDRTVSLFLGDSVDPENITAWQSFVVPASGGTQEAVSFEYTDNEPCTILIANTNGAVNYYYVSATNVEGGGNSSENPDTPDTPVTGWGDWNFSNWTAGDITETTEKDGLTLYAGTRNNADGDPTTYKWTIDANSKTFSGISCTQRLKSNGNAMWNEDGTPFARVMEFKVNGPSTITIAAMSSSSGATDRTVSLFLGDSVDPENLNPWQSFVVPASGGTQEAVSFEYNDNEPCTILIANTNGAVNYYYVSATNSGSGIEHVFVGSNEVSAEYYNLQGVRVNSEYKGLCIKVSYNADGTRTAAKVIR